MGCLAGPVVVCAVAMTNAFYNKAHTKLRGVTDSKLLQAKQREIFSAELLREKDLLYALALAYPKTIDKLNIYRASRLAMRKAIAKISNFQFPISNQFSNFQLSKKDQWKPRSIVLVDGNKKIPGLMGEQKTIVGGDRKVFAISCASIIAKVYRDKMMVKYSKKYPNYGFEKHKGYGTKYHQAQLTALGPCDIHRKSFRLKY